MNDQMTTTKSVAQASAEDQQLQLVTFEVAGEEYAVDILAVQEINRMMEVTRVPQSPLEVEGVINLRGRIIPVIDIRMRFGMEKGERDQHSRIIVVEVGGRVLGFIVDCVHEVMRIRQSIVDAPPPMAGTAGADFIAGVGKLDDRLLLLLDLDRLFGADTLAVVDETVAQAA